MRRHMDRLLTRLAAGKGATVPHDVLMLAVWDDAPPESAEITLRVMIHRLRKQLGPGSITNDHGLGYSLRPDVVLPPRHVDDRLLRPAE